MKFPLSSIVHDRSCPVKGILWPMMLAIGLFGCGQAPEHMIEVSGRTMGTSYHIKIVGYDIDSPALKSRIDARLAALNDVFSTYIASSELSKINSELGGEPIAISDELDQVLQFSREIFEISGGAFDVTVGPLVNLWGFGPEGPAHGIPARKAIDEALARVGFSKITIKAQSITAPEGLSIDLSAIAKGYAVDEISELLDAAGASRYMVEIGGEVRTRGVNNRGVAWVIGVEVPDSETRRLQRTLPLKDMAMATSGDYRNFFEVSGRRYSHTLDPVTGWPVNHSLASVTVLHTSAAYADGLATAFSVLGLEKTMEIAEAHQLLVLAIIRESGSLYEIQSSALKAYLTVSQSTEATP